MAHLAIDQQPTERRAPERNFEAGIFSGDGPLEPPGILYRRDVIDGSSPQIDAPAIEGGSREPGQGFDNHVMGQTGGYKAESGSAIRRTVSGARPRSIWLTGLEVRKLSATVI
jgi:hypothetical protein